MSIFSRFFKSKKKSRTTKAAVKLQQPNISATKVENSPEEIVVEPIDHDIDALYDILVDIEGADRLVLKASKLEALTLIRSNNRNQRILGLQKIVYENPTLDKLPKDDEIPTLLKEMMDYLANIMARRSFEDELEKRISAKMEENHQDYIFNIKKQILKEESSLKESSQSLAKLKQLEDKNKIHLTKSIMELLRPENLSEIIGQERAIKALKAKLSSPYPQHLILYGPPGVGKTTAARLVLQEACTQPHTPFNADAPFVETDGTTLRYDPRGIANPLLGSVIEIEAIAFKAYEKGKGILRFNQTAGSMAQDSVFNAAAVVRKLTNEDIHDYDIHINIIGGGNIDGPSAGTAILIALISAITQKPIRQDIAITGEISIQGLVRPVGGVFEKAYGASQAGIKTLIIPEENAKDIPPDLHGLKVHPVKTAQEALAFAFDKI